MAVDEATRYRLHDRLTETLGDEMATALMEHLPPSGWSDVVRQSDLEALEQRMELRFQSLESRMDLRFQAVDQRFEATEQRIEAAEQRVLAALHQELGALRQEFAVQTRSFLVALVGLTVVICTFAFTAAKLL